MTMTMDHQPSSIQISPGQLQSELESIRSLRRISLSQPSSDLDPDLPSGLQIDPSNNHASHHNQPQRGTHSPSHSNPDSSAQDQPHPDLFWLPARLHPEIAPQEFKAFIEEATKPENLLRRTSSALGSRRPNPNDPSNPTSITRKKSMLSKVYHPSEHDLSSLPTKPTTTSDSSSILRGYSMSSPNHRGRGAQGLDTLTINDLQKLEVLVSKKPSANLDSDLQTLDLYDHRIQSIISRSLSLGGNPSASLNDSESSPDTADSEAIDDSPLISRAPGHIIRRTARTKVRKPLLPGDGNGHRFAATRRTQAKSPLLTTSPGTVSVASNTSEETLSNDIHSNRNSSKNIQISNGSISSDDPLGPGIGASDSKRLSQRPSSNPVSGSKSSPSSLLDAPPPHHHPPSSEDDQSISSTSRPDSVISNSSLLDAYAYEGAPSDDPASTINFGNFDLNESSISSPSTIDLVTSNTLKSDQLLSTDQDIPQIPTPNSISLPPPANHQFISFPGSSKPDVLKVVTHNLPDPLSVRTSLSSDDPLSTPTTRCTAVSVEGTSASSSTINSNSSSGTLPSSSPQNPYSSHSPRPTLGTTKTSPNLTTPSSSIASPILPVVGTKEGKEKKRTWVKLGLASAVSPSSKSKKGKDKQKTKADSQQTVDGSSGSSSNPTAALSGGSVAAATVPTKKESGFLSGLFGGKSKKQDSEQDKQTPSQSTENAKSSTNNSNFGGSNLPGEIQGQQQLINPTASGGFIKGRFMSFYRLPIHVERAVYRLSHIKLANPRRPLYEQVLISNLMFWYLGVINKAQSIPPITNQPQPSTTAPVSSPTPPVPSSSNYHRQNNGNLTNEKTRTSPTHQTTKAQKRGPGMKKNWKKNQGQESNISSNATASTSSTTINQEWIEPDSSESSDSEPEEQEATRRKGNQEKAPSSSSSSSASSSSTISSSDDDERPLGSRMGLTKKNNSPSPSLTNLNTSSSSSINNNNNKKLNNKSVVPPLVHHNKDCNHHLSGYNSRSNPNLVKPKN